MAYFCKGCGAVVTGKYCSCCGKKALPDFEEYCLRRNRMRRAFIKKKTAADSPKMRCIEKSPCETCPCPCSANVCNRWKDWFHIAWPRVCAEVQMQLARRRKDGKL